MTSQHVKITVTLPPEDMAAVDRLAAELDRPRSWVIAEALRSFVAEREQPPAHRLDPLRRAQLDRDLEMTAEERIHDAEERTDPRHVSQQLETPRTFKGYDAFDAWRRAARER